MDSHARPAKRQRTAEPDPLLSPPPPHILSHPIHAPPHYLQRPPTPFQQPSHLTSFSYSPTRDLLLHKDTRDDALAYYREPPAGADLNDGFEQCVWRDENVDEGLDSLLEALEQYIREDSTGQATETVQKLNVITWRGMMTKLLLAVYECASFASSNGRGRSEGWDMNAMVIDGCLYLEQSHTLSSLAAKAASESSYKLQSYYGYSFESFSTTPSRSTSSSSTKPPPTTPFEPPNTNVQWCSVIKTNLGGYRTCLGGEVDCILPPPRDLEGVASNSRSKGTKDFVELKTNIVISSQRDEIMFEKQKLLKHYVQSFLLGVPTIIIGFRTRPGILSAIQTFKTLEIPRLVRGKPHAWEPSACLTSGYELLDFIFKSISSHPRTRSHQSIFTPSATSSSSFPKDQLSSWPVFRISFDPTAAKIDVRELSQGEVEDEVKGGKMDRERIGFVLERWVRGGWERRREQVRKMPKEEVKSASPISTPIPPKTTPSILPGLKR